METDPKDVWMTLKTSWIPQPRWLSANIGESATAPIAPAPIQQRRRGDPVFMLALDSDTGQAIRETAPAPVKGKRKILREFGGNRSTRDERAISIERMETKSFAEQGIDYLRPGQDTAIPTKLRSKKRKVHMDNVVELRPRLRDEIYATKILDALCKACEAHAAGEDELLMVRIKMLYHMFDDVVR